MKVPYRSSHPQAKKKVRIVRNANHNCIPNLTGKAMPRADDEETRDIYCATILALFKPWRKMEDLQADRQTWEDAFAEFKLTAPRSCIKIMQHIQYSYRSKDAADAEREADPAQGEIEGRDVQYPQVDDDKQDHAATTGTEPTEIDIALAKQNQMDPRSREFAFQAIAAGHVSGVFTPSEKAALKPPTRKAEGNDLIRLVRWRAAIENQVQEQQEENTGKFQETDADVTRIDVNLLNSQESNQRRAYDIITKHFDKQMRGERPSQLLMHIQGEGGTCKSKVIQTVTQYFAQRGCVHMMQKMAYTGIAASLIEGKTTHSAASISKQTSKGLTDAKKRKLEELWKTTEYIIIDEISMIDREVFAILSRNIAIAKKSKNPDDTHAPFGGISVILCGDFHHLR
ncbi:hypothetical protein QCA50_017782 [Cerrena zonata]|uniref:ATP-dependent DNA helicase n=1 Tax=Cerrena zonata TaxID=2478898 RepID=A0AAW0FJU2_9APHY